MAIDFAKLFVCVCARVGGCCRDENSTSANTPRVGGFSG